MIVLHAIHPSGYPKEMHLLQMSINFATQSFYQVDFGSSGDDIIESEHLALSRNGADFASIEVKCELDGGLIRHRYLDISATARNR